MHTPINTQSLSSLPAMASDPQGDAGIGLSTSSDGGAASGQANGGFAAVFSGVLAPGDGEAAHQDAHHGSAANGTAALPAAGGSPEAEAEGGLQDLPLAVQDLPLQTDAPAHGSSGTADSLATAPFSPPLALPAAALVVDGQMNAAASTSSVAAVAGALNATDALAMEQARMNAASASAALTADAVLPESLTATGNASLPGTESGLPGLPTTAIAATGTLGTTGQGGAAASAQVPQAQNLAPAVPTDAAGVTTVATAAQTQVASTEAVSTEAELTAGRSEAASRGSNADVSGTAQPSVVAAAPANRTGTTETGTTDTVTTSVAAAATHDAQSPAVAATVSASAAAPVVASANAQSSLTSAARSTRATPATPATARGAADADMTRAAMHASESVVDDAFKLEAGSDLPARNTLPQSAPANVPGVPAAAATGQAASITGLPTGVAPTLEAAGATSQGAQLQVVQPDIRAANWSAAVGERLVMLARGGDQSAELTLNPPNLGKLSVQISMDSDNASVQFATPHAAVRDALEAALPRLREMMAEGGLQLVNVDVSHQEAGTQQGASDGDGNRAPLAAGETSGDDAEQAAPVPATVGLVDAFV